MADNKRNRTNWSDKARRITGGVTLAVVILIIVLCVVLGKKNKSAEPTAQPVPVVTEVKEPEKKPEPTSATKEEPVSKEPAVVEKVSEPAVPIIEEPVKDIVSEEVEYTSGEYSFDVCGITVLNSWKDGVFVSTSADKERFLSDAVIEFVRYEADKYKSLMDKDTVMKIVVADGTIKVEYPSFINPELLMPYYKADIEEYAASLVPIEEPVVEVIEEPSVVEEPRVTETPEVISGSSEFEVFGFVVRNSWNDGEFVSSSAIKGLLSEDDVRGFCQYEVGKYGSFLSDNVSVSFIPDGMVLSIPKSVDPSLYISTYKSDIEEYVSYLFAPKAEEPVAEEVSPVEEDFTVFGYTVKNSWVPGTFTSLSETKGLVAESDVRGFAEYEVGKYGDMLLENAVIEIVPDGFVLTIPENIDPSLYISTYKSDIEEYVSYLFAPKAEEPTKIEVAEAKEEPVVEETVIVPSAPLAPVAVDVPQKVEVVEVAVSPKAEKLSSYKFKLGFGAGAEFGINNAVDYLTIFPRLSLTADFQNVFSISRMGFGVRLDLSGVFKPIDGTFIGHDFEFFLNGNNWAVDATADAKLMVYANWDRFQLYAGGGIGYSIASHSMYPYTHTDERTVFGFDTALAVTAVAGFDWRVGNKFTLTVEGNYRYFLQSESNAQAFALTVAMGYKF